MSFRSSLTIGRTCFQPHALRSFSYQGCGLAIRTSGSVLMVEGSQLHHCAIDLLNGLCEEIVVSSEPVLSPLGWQAQRINPASRVVSGDCPVAAFEVIVPEGWLLFEETKAWHFWPSKDLYAIVETESRLLFVYADTTIEVTAPMERLRQAFDAIKSGSGGVRHYTGRDAGDYLNLVSANRLYGSGIHLRRCHFEAALKGKTIGRFHSLSPRLPKPPERKRPIIDR